MNSATSDVPVTRRMSVVLALAALVAVSVVSILSGNGHIAVAVVPVALVAVVMALCLLPLNETLPAIAFLCLTLENPSEFPAAGVWQSPIYTVGALFLNHMNSVLPVRALIVSGLDIALVVLAIVIMYRRASKSDVDAGGFVPAAQPVQQAALACIASILFVWAFGLARGGSFANSLWQVFRVIYMPFVLLLFAAGLRGPSDIGKLGRVLVSAAIVRGIVAIYVRQLFPDFEEVPFTTVHADSMLFANASLLIVAMLLERPTPRVLLLASTALPIIVWGMIANTRRLVWVELGSALAVIYLLARWTIVKRRIAQAIVLSLPFALAYVGTGWAHPTGIFSPVRTIRSVLDSKSDGSTAWRDLENYNLYFTQRQHPLTGTGFGHEYEETVKLPDIASGEHGYALYRYAPHNSVLGLLTYAGVIGFTGIWMIIPLGMFFAVRTYRFCTTSRDRIATLTTVGILVTYGAHCYGDMGLGTFTSVFTVAPAVALIAKMAVATGAWPVRVQNPRRADSSVLIRTVEGHEAAG